MSLGFSINMTNFQDQKNKRLSFNLHEDLPVGYPTLDWNRNIYYLIVVDELILIPHFHKHYGQLLHESLHCSFTKYPSCSVSHHAPVLESALVAS